MEICNCHLDLDKYFCDIPVDWRTGIINALCFTLNSFPTFNCDMITNCETLTTLSGFTLNDDILSFSYKNEKNQISTRSIDLKPVFNELLNDIDPLCLMSSESWALLTFSEKLQVIIDGVSDCGCCPTTTTTTTTTSSTTTTTTAASLYDYYIATIFTCEEGICTEELEEVTVYFTSGTVVNIGDFYELIDNTIVRIDSVTTEDLSANFLDTVGYPDCSVFCPEITTTTTTTTTTSTTTTTTSTTTTSSSTTTTTTEVPCDCADGYSPLPDNSGCVKEETVSATIVNSGYCLAPSPLAGVYSSTGTFLMNPGYNTDLTGSYTYLNTLYWKEQPASIAGPMNRESVWIDTDCNGVKDALSAGAVLNITIPIYSATPRTVYVGIGGDNTFKLQVNNVTIVNCGQSGNTAGGLGISANFNIWWLFPVNLTSGVSYFNFQAIGDGSTNDSFAAVIYDNIASDFASATSNANLNILFKTSTYRGSTIDIATCPATYFLDTSGGSGSYVCKKILTLGCGEPTTSTTTTTTAPVTTTTTTTTPTTTTTTTSGPSFITGSNIVEGCISTGRILSVTDNAGLIDFNYISGDPYPLTSGTSNYHLADGTGTISLIVNVDGLAGSIEVTDTNGTVQCLGYAGAGDYTFNNFVIGGSVQSWQIIMRCGGCT